VGGVGVGVVAAEIFGDVIVVVRKDLGERHGLHKLDQPFASSRGGGGIKLYILQNSKCLKKNKHPPPTRVLRDREDAEGAHGEVEAVGEEARAHEGDGGEDELVAAQVV
jgi:hypothetical protein